MKSLPEIVAVVWSMTSPAPILKFPLKKKVGNRAGNIETAAFVGTDIAKKAKEKGIKEV